MNSESDKKNKKHLSVVVTERGAAYADVVDGPAPTCGDCMWLNLRRASEVEPCAETKFPDGVGGTYRVTADSDTCKYFTPKSPELEAMYQAYMSIPVNILREARKILTPIIREKEAATAEEKVIGVKDTVEYTLTERDAINTYTGTVIERGRAHVKVARKAPTVDDPDHMEIERLPLSLLDHGTMRVIKSHAIESLGDGVIRHSKSSGDPEQIRKVKARRAKRMRTVLETVGRYIRQNEKRAPMSAILEAMDSVDAETIKQIVRELRSIKMLARVKGKYKLTELGAHSIVRLKKANDVVATWYKLENRARKNAGIAPSAAETAVTSTPVPAAVVQTPPWEDDDGVGVVTTTPKTSAAAPPVTPVAQKKKLLSLVR